MSVLWKRLCHTPPRSHLLGRYYYTGIKKSFDMLHCESADPGVEGAASYVVTIPSVTCYEGDHVGYMVLASIGVFLYMVVRPGDFAYVLLSMIPRNGQEDRMMVRNFGFLYKRFEPDKWWWELVRI